MIRTSVALISIAFLLTSAGGCTERNSIPDNIKGPPESDARPLRDVLGPTLGHNLAEYSKCDGEYRKDLPFEKCRFRGFGLSGRPGFDYTVLHGDEHNYIWKIESVFRYRFDRSKCDIPSVTFPECDPDYVPEYDRPGSSGQLDQRLKERIDRYQQTGLGDLFAYRQGVKLTCQPGSATYTWDGSSEDFEGWFCTALIHNEAQWQSFVDEYGRD